MIERRRRAATSPSPTVRRSGLVSSRARFAARAAAARRRRPWMLTAWLLALVAIVAGGVWVVAYSTVLAARSVRVEGVPSAEARDITRRAAVPLGTPLARVDTRAIAARVIESATLAQVTVSRAWPSTVVIAASPRVPVVAVKNPQGQVQVVDAKGVAYATVAGAPAGVPLITTVESPPSSESLRSGIAVLAALSPALSPAQRRSVSNVTVSGASVVTLKVGAVTVVWGGASEPALKVKVLTALLKQPGVRTIDVSAPRSPATI